MAAGALASSCALALPATAAAHGLIGKQNLPIPEWLFGWTAAVVLVGSFLALASLWPKPRLESSPERRLFALPGWVDPLCGLVGVAAFAFVVYAGLAGNQIDEENIAPAFIYVWFWVGWVAVSVLLGDVFKAFNPWRALARFAAWVAVRLGRADAPPPLPYPERLGRWPAVLGILAFAWLELIYVNHDDPSTLAVLALAYAAVQLLGMSLYGIDAWSERGDAFGTYFGLFARLSVFARRGRDVVLRRPLSGVTGLEPIAGTFPLLCAMIGSTAFDGFEQGSLWTGVKTDSGLKPFLESHFVGRLHLGLNATSELTDTIGLLGWVLIIALIYKLGVRGMRSVREGQSDTALKERFVHTLVPISLAYVLAHYFTFLVFQGQLVTFLASDPLGRGSDVFGTAGGQVSYFLGANAIWYLQVGMLVLGHVGGIVLAHDRALVVYDKPREAARSQYWMLCVMVGFTSLGLWLLSAASR